MAAHRLPNEIWLYIFELATAEHASTGKLPNSMDKSVWFKNVFDTWGLQSPDELAMNAQKKRYKTVKVRRTGSVDVREAPINVKHSGHPLNLQALAPYRRRIPVQSRRDLQAISHASSV